MNTFEVSHNPHSVRFPKQDHWLTFEEDAKAFEENGLVMTWTIRANVLSDFVRLGDRVLVYLTGQAKYGRKNGLVGVAYIFGVVSRNQRLRRLKLVFSGFQGRPVPISRRYQSMARSISRAKLNAQINRAIRQLEFGH